MITERNDSQLYRINYYGITHTGKLRPVNQDNYICGKAFHLPDSSDDGSIIHGSVSLDDSHLFAVFDGLGGEECGEQASLIAAQKALKISFTDNVIDNLKNYCQTANDEICSYAGTNHIGSMGTTAAILTFTQKEIVLCNIGDSKIFRFSDSKLEQISHDHVTVSPFGVKPPLSQNLGIPKQIFEIKPYFSRGEYCENDIYLICSDGLTDMLPSEEIEQTIKETDYDNLAAVLLDKSLSAGGKDNITIIVCKVEKEKSAFANLFRKRDKTCQKK